MPKDDTFTTIVKIIFGLVIAGALFNALVMPTLVAWWVANGWIVLAVLGILGAIGVGVFVLWLLRDYISDRLTDGSYTETPGAGHYPHSSASSGIEVHSIGLPVTRVVNDIAQNPSLAKLNTVTSAIQEFQPFRQYKFENQYQIDLGRHDS